MKFIVNVAALLLALTVVACGGGGVNSVTNPSLAGDLVMETSTSSDADVVLGGTHKYVVSLVGAENLSEPVMVTVTSSNGQVAPIESNSCAISGLLSNSESDSCDFFVRGISRGSATITVSANNYPTMIESLNVSQQWGTFSGAVMVGKTSMPTDQLTFGGDYLYSFDRNAVAKSNGNAWRIVGGGDVITDEFLEFPEMASESSSVCVSAVFYDNQSILTKVKCSTNDSLWQTLPILAGWEVDKISLYKGNVYVLVYSITLGVTVMSCPINNCITWQQQGQLLPYSSSYQGYAMFESKPFIQNQTGIYSQDGSGAWQLYGSYVPSGSNLLAAGVDGVTILPLTDESIQQIYYNGIPGNAFTTISTGITTTDSPGNAGLAMSNHTEFANPGDGNIYSSTSESSIWSPWSKVGQNTVQLGNVYVNNDKVYALQRYTGSNTLNYTQIYVYSLTVH